MDFNEIFPDNREKGETRIRQSQLVMLRMVKIFDFLCSKHSIKYFLTGGSLLGAIRHNGFIPWDDDLDIGMTREEYDKFVQYAVPELPFDFFFQTHETDEYYPACDFVEAKLRDRYSNYNVNKYKYHDGIQLDLFVYDKSFLANNFLILVQNRLLKILRNNKMRGRILTWIAKNTPFQMVYSSSYIQDFGSMKNGTYVTKSELSDFIRIQFEDFEALIPKGWHSYLERQYGNYMKLPPPDRRNAHHDNLPDPFNPCQHKEILQWPVEVV